MPIRSRPWTCQDDKFFARGKVASTPSSGGGGVADRRGGASSHPSPNPRAAYLSPNPRRAAGGGGSAGRRLRGASRRPCRTSPRRTRAHIASYTKKKTTTTAATSPTKRTKDWVEGMKGRWGSHLATAAKATAAPWGGFQDERLAHRHGRQGARSTDFGVFGVFDGHGDGGHASDYVAKNLWGKLTSNPSGRRRTAHATPTSSPRRSYRPVVIWTKVSWGG